MLETQAIVIRVGEGVAYVETRRQSGCGHCDSKNGCATSSIGKLFGADGARFRALNPVGAGVGDSVLIGVEDGALFKSSLAVYLVPLLLVILGAAWAGSVAPSSAAADGYSIAGAFLGLVAGYFWLRILTSAIGSSRRFQPVILGKVREQGFVPMLKESQG